MKKKSRAQIYLEQAEKYDLMIQNKEAEKAQWKAIALGVTSGGESTLVYVGNSKYELQNMDKVQSSGSQQKMAAAIERYIEIDREIDEIIDRLYDAKQDIIRTIEPLPTDEYDVLHKRYIQGMNHDEIAAKKNKSKSWVDNIHGQALLSVQKELKNRGIV